MPIYVYGCQDCGAEEEHIQRFSDPPLTECSSCGGHLSKQITSAAFHLKGGGWYRDGYASAKAGGGSDASDAGSSASSDSAGSSTSADTKSKSDTKVKASKSKSDGGSKRSTKAAAAE